MRQAVSYGIVDRKLLFDRYLQRMSHKGMALYLFLVLAADRDGRSYYGDRTIGEILRLSPSELAHARSELIGAGLIGYQRPNWRGETLSHPARRLSQRPAPRPCADTRPSDEPRPICGLVPEGLKALLNSMEEKI